MIHVETMPVNPFGMNTYVLSDESNECVIIDPGFFDQEEENMLLDYLREKQLKVVRLINTHCHVDHILGNRFIADQFKLKIIGHREEQYNISYSNQKASIYGLPNPNSPDIEIFVDEGDEISFGESFLKVLFTPGHTSGHISLYAEKESFVICGDVLFHGSIGRTDLPGGDYDTLIESIKRKLLTLPDETIVHSGHGPSTRIDLERRFNPFLQE